MCHYQEWLGSGSSEEGRGGEGRGGEGRVEEGRGREKSVIFTLVRLIMLTLHNITIGCDIILDIV